MIVGLRYLLGWFVSVFSRQRISSSKISLCGSNCWLCTPGDLQGAKGGKYFQAVFLVVIEEQVCRGRLVGKRFS